MCEACAVGARHHLHWRRWFFATSASLRPLR